jgi:hypothetical protein
MIEYRHPFYPDAAWRGHYCPRKAANLGLLSGEVLPFQRGDALLQKTKALVKRG